MSRHVTEECRNLVENITNSLNNVKFNRSKCTMRMLLNVLYQESGD